MEWDNSQLFILTTIHRWINLLDITASDVFQSLIGIMVLETALDGPGQGYVSLNLDRKGFFSMLLELLISLRIWIAIF